MNIDDLFNGAIKAWSGERIRVVVRISPDVAWMAHEYPWGSKAVSLSPPGLVDAVRAELVAALHGYAGARGLRLAKTRLGVLEIERTRRKAE
jgi:hypothetical protein